jgi:hypothetical protein
MLTTGISNERIIRYVQLYLTARHISFSYTREEKGIQIMATQEKKRAFKS